MSTIRAPKKATATCGHGDWIRIFWEEKGKEAPELRAAAALKRHMRRKHPPAVGSVQNAQHLRPVQR